MCLPATEALADALGAIIAFARLPAFGIQHHKAVRAFATGLRAQPLSLLQRQVQHAAFAAAHRFIPIRLAAILHGLNSLFGQVQNLAVALCLVAARIEADAVVLFNRLNDVKLEVADRAVGAVRVSGICWVDNPRAFARMVEATFGVRVEERSSGGIVFRSDRPVD